MYRCRPSLNAMRQALASAILSGQIVAFHRGGDVAYVGRAWQYPYRIWLPSGAFEPAGLQAMEMFVRLPEEIGWETFDLQACIPVVRL